MELLSPAGDQEALIAAVRNGADAVYLGAQALNARRGAGNFDADGLLWASDYCHERGRKLYVTVNTLVRQDELPILEGIAAQMARAGVDAAIVQDLGAAALLGQMLPGLALHASTQMAVHNRHGVRFLKEAGFERAVLAREMRFDQINECAKEGLALEVFCHGALCVSCSGQCLFSSLVGGRSGNRGMCAQPCRLPYTLSGPDFKAQGYLLSPRDLMQLHQLDALRQAGATSLKIEGRLKRPEYVALVTRIYREALDGAEVGEAQRDALLQMFNRGGFTSGYGPGLKDAELIYDERPNHLGLAVGACEADGRVRLTRDVLAEDALTLSGSPVRLSGRAGERVRAGDAKAGEPLMRLVDEAQMREARASYALPESPSVDVHGRAVLRVGQPMSLWVSDGSVEVEAHGAVVESAQKMPADPERARMQLNKTGGTPYRFASLDILMDAAAFLPVSALNALRRDALDALSAARITQRRGCVPQVLPRIEPALVKDDSTAPELVVQSGDLSLLKQALEWGADALTFEPRDLSTSALALLRPDAPIRLALPMTCTDGDLLALHAWAEEHSRWITGVLVANPAHLSLRWPGQIDADYSMNVANNHTVWALLQRGVRRYTPSVELTAQQTLELLGERELIVYGRLPLMQLRHCPLHARCGSGAHEDCHRCDAGNLVIEQCTLIDRKGVRFPFQRLKTQAGCMIRTLNSVPMMLLRHTARLPGAAAWRLILTDEPGALCEAIVRLHRAALEHKDHRQCAQWALLEGLGSTTGHYFRGVD